MKDRIGKMCMVLGVLCIVSAVVLLFWNQRTDKKATEQSRNVLEEIQTRGSSEEKSQTISIEMPEMIIDGHSYIGYVTVPVLGLQLPVMSELDNTRLQIAPCRYFGSVQTNDLVIAGHNYRGHFGNLKNIKMAEEVWFTDVSGLSTIYSVEEIQVLEATAIEEMTSGSYDLSLFTCTYGGQSRLAVRCMRK